MLQIALADETARLVAYAVFQNKYIFHFIIFKHILLIKEGFCFMKEIIFKGVGTAIATPFTDKGINFDEFGKLLDYQIEKGVNAIIVCGTTGESATMSLDEKKELDNVSRLY